MVTICPSILSADFSRLAEDIQDVERKGADCIHLDLMDGHFVPNLTFGVPVVKALRGCTKLPFDAHLMVEHPETYIDGLPLPASSTSRSIRKPAPISTGSCSRSTKPA